MCVKTANIKDIITLSKDYFNGDEKIAELWANIYSKEPETGKYFLKTPQQFFMHIAEKINEIERNFPNVVSTDIIYKLINNSEIILSKSIVDKLIKALYKETILNDIVINNKYLFDKNIESTIINDEADFLFNNKINFGHNLSYLNPKNNSLFKIIEKYYLTNLNLKAEEKCSRIFFSLSINHPSIIDLLEIDDFLLQTSAIYFTIIINDKFIEYVKNNDTVTLQYPINSNNPEITTKINARDLLNKISEKLVENLHFEILFEDNYIKESINEYHFKDIGISCTFSCEIAKPYESTDVVAINLFNLVENPFSKNAKFNYKKLKENIKSAVHILDDIIELNINFINTHLNSVGNTNMLEYNLFSKIKYEIENYRKIGISIIGFADMLLALNLQYSSKKSIKFADKLFKNFSKFAYTSSVELAKERGSFIEFDFIKEKSNNYLQKLYNDTPTIMKNMAKYGRRNISLIEIVPPGDTGLLANLSFTAHPKYYAFINIFNIEGSIKTQILTTSFKVWLKHNNYNISEFLSYDTEKQQEIIDSSPFKDSFAYSIMWQDRLEMQKTIQNRIDGIESSAINLSNKTKIEDITNIIVNACSNNIKYLTLYINTNTL